MVCVVDYEIWHTGAVKAQILLFRCRVRLGALEEIAVYHYLLFDVEVSYAAAFSIGVRGDTVLLSFHLILLGPSSSVVMGRKRAGNPM